jgi:flagellar biogenesis protein FliO
MWLSLTLLATISGTVTAFGLWKRRSAPLVRRMRILETASLGAKRALILAEVDGVMMVIGASEAGIVLLAAPTPATNDGAIPSNEAADEEGDSTFGARATSHALAQSGALHRLFPRSSSPTRSNQHGTSTAEGWTNAPHRTTPEN